MPIEALPQNAVQAIGSSQCLTDSHSLIKELIENAIDARATSVTIEVSGNILDKILVKDNGHGIAPEDRTLLCQRSCTSKIRNLEDLERIGGRSLGFRGEALHSAATLSGLLKITTRVEGEETATELTYGSQGSRTGEKRVSHPPGTTVALVEFLKTMPVRRQNAMKQHASQLARVKHTMQSYILAHPSIRMNLKILKAKKDAQHFIYAPKHAHLGSQPDPPSMEDAAIKIFGVKISEHYSHLTWNSSNSLEPQRSADISMNLSQSLNEQGYVFQAYLPKADSTFECSHIIPPRHFLSVDSRPLSGRRGTMKQITSIFKKHFKSASTSSAKGHKVDPIMCLNIVCPRGSYDANIEPAKDDVLFTSPSTVLDSAEAFFKSVYGDLTVADQPMNAKAIDSDASFQDLMLAQKPDRLSTSDFEQLAQGPLLSPHARSTSIPSGQESSTDGENRSHGGLLEEDNPENDISISNPWAFAKFNSKMRAKPKPSGNAGHDEDVQLPTHEQEQRQTRLTPDRTGPLNKGLLSPDLSSPSPFPYPLSARPKSHKNNEQSSQPRNDNPTAIIGGLDNYFQSPHSQSSEEPALCLDATTDLGGAESRTEHPSGFRTAAAIPHGTALSNIPDISELTQRKSSARRKESKFLHKPFTPPVNNLQDVWFKTGTASHGKQSQNRGANNSNGYSTTNIPALNLREDETSEPAPSGSPLRPSSPTHPDLALSMDYETRKARATADYRLAQSLQRREALQQQKRQAAAEHLNGPPSPTSIPSPRISLPPSKPSPHMNRQRNAIAALNPPIPQPAALDPYDPRACLIRHQQAQSEVQGKGGNRSRRLRLAQLPLETVRAEDAVQDLVLTLSIPISDVAQEVQRNPDAADGSGDEGSAFEMCGDEDVKYWQEIVEGLTS